MPRFRYVALDPEARPQTGVITAESEETVRTQLEALQLRIVEVTMVAANESPKLSESEQVEVFEQVSDAVEMGLSLSITLRAVAEEVPGERLQQTFQQMSDDLEAGLSIEATFNKQSAGLPSYLVSMVQSSVGGGNLAKGLRQFSEALRSRQALQRSIRSALAYPAVLMLFGGAVFAALMAFVVPIFWGIFEGFGTELPSMTASLLSVSNVVVALVRYWFIALPTLVGLLIATPSVWRWMRAGETTSALMQIVPVFGGLLHNRSLAEFCEVLAMLIEFRVPLPVALRLAGSAVDNGSVRAAANRMSEAVLGGASPGWAAESLRIFPSTLARAWVGKPSPSQLATSLRVSSRLFAANALVGSRMVGLVVEPLMVIGLGVMFGTVVVALFMPMIKLLNDLS